MLINRYILNFTLICKIISTLLLLDSMIEEETQMIGYCVGVIQDTPGHTIGYRLVFIEQLLPNVQNIQKRVMNITATELYTRLKANPGLVRNLKIDKKEILGRGGALTRYGVVNSSDMSAMTQSITIIAETYSHDSEFLGYICSDTNGMLAEFTEEFLVKLSERMQLANGKIVTRGGSTKVAAIEGGYDVYNKPKTRATRKKTTTQVVTTEAKNSVHMEEKSTTTKTPAQPIKVEEASKSPVASHVASPEIRNTTHESDNSGGTEDTYKAPKKELYDQQNHDSQAHFSTEKQENTYNSNKITHEGECPKDSQAHFSTEDKKVDDTTEKPVDIKKRQKTEDEMAAERINKARVIVIELMKFKGYPESYAAKIVATIAKYKKCSLKQYNALKDIYTSWTMKNLELLPGKKLIENPNIKLDDWVIEQNEDKPDNTGKVVEAKKEEPVHTEPIAKPETESDNPSDELAEDEIEIDLTTIPVARKANIAAALPVKTASEETEQGSFNYEIIDGKMYITKFRELRDEEGEIRPDSPVDIVIPRETVYNGKTYKITGISARAFANTSIKSVKVGSNITDLGQWAFAHCNRLESLDISESSITLTPRGLCTGCTALKAVKLGRNLERIHEDAFLDCINLVSVDAGYAETIASNAFKNCVSLSIYTGTAKIINDSAFKYCVSLKDFDFSKTVSIGTTSFRCCGFEKLTIPSNVQRLGKKSFDNCYALKEIYISEGVQEVGEWCFAKQKETCRRELAECRKVKLLDSFVETEAINTPKSIEKMGTNPYAHAKIVYGYIGTLSESSCLTYGIMFVKLDAINLQNSTKIRLKSTMLGVNAIKYVFRDFNNIKDGVAAKTDVELKTDKLIKIDLKPEIADFLHLQRTTEVIDPNAKFIGALNLMQDLTDVYALPLSNKFLALKDAYYVSNEIIYDDGCNKIIKLKYTLKDSLLSGCYWMFIMDNKMVYCAHFNKQTNMKMRPEIIDSNTIGLDTHLHTGDRIGFDSAFNGAAGVYETEEELANGQKRKVHHDVGELVQRTLDNLGVIIDVTNSTRYLYVPSAITDKKALKLVDITQSFNDKQKKAYTQKYKQTNDPLPIGSYTINGILTYEELIKEIKSESDKSEDIKFFTELSKLTADEVQAKLTDMKTIGVEMEAQLFRVSKEFNKILETNHIDAKDIDPAYMNESVLNGLADSYLMVVQDERWFKTVQSKSLNKTHEYTIGKYVVTEMQSNQVIKFSNPYMSGRKGAYVFTFSIRGEVYGIYASRYSLGEMANMLHKMTYIPKNIDVATLPHLMTDAKNLDKVNPKLFYHFFPVLSHSDDWRVADRLYHASWSSRRLFNNFFVTFNISMYKPNGIFYLTMERYVKETGDKTSKMMVLPIIPIGNMDRALLVADTTNKNNSKSDFLTDMLGLCVAEVYKENNIESSGQPVEGANINGYYLARQLIMNRDRTMSKYEDLVSDRALYMIGVLHTGELLREGYDYDDDDIDFGDDIIEGLEDDDDDFDMADAVEEDDDIDFGEYDDDDLEDALEEDDESPEFDAEAMLSVDVDSTDLPEDEKEQLRQLQQLLLSMPPEERQKYLNGGE